MKIYHYHPVTGEYIGSGQADQSPLEPGVWLIPANATTIPPPAVPGAQQAVRWTGAAWELVLDRRGETYWLPDGSEHKVEALGEAPPAGALLAPPPSPPPPPRLDIERLAALLVSKGILTASEIEAAKR